MRKWRGCWQVEAGLKLKVFLFKVFKGLLSIRLLKGLKGLKGLKVLKGMEHSGMSISWQG